MYHQQNHQRQNLHSPFLRFSSRQASLVPFRGVVSRPPCPRGPPSRGRPWGTAITHYSSTMSALAGGAQAWPGEPKLVGGEKRLACRVHCTVRVHWYVLTHRPGIKHIILLTVQY